jgi:hypothetical protein
MVLQNIDKTSNKKSIETVKKMVFLNVTFLVGIIENILYYMVLKKGNYLILLFIILILNLNLRCHVMMIMYIHLFK